MPRLRHKVVVALVATMAFAGFTACGEDDLTVDAGDAVGTWTGTTSQSRDVNFIVTSDGVSDGEFAYQMTGVCNFNSAQAINQSLSISKGRFTTGKTQIGAGTGGGAFITIDGEFTSSTTARGTFLIQHAPCADTLSLTWTATKQ